jgi:hypothetical protein
MRSKLSLIVVVAGLVAIRCSDSPTEPTPPPPAVGAVTLVPGTNWLTLGSSVSFTAFVTMTNGSGQAMDATWRSSNTAIAEVSDRGMVRAIGAGRVTITATASGVAGTRAIRVAPDFTSTWAGRAVVEQCVDVVGALCASEPRGASNLGAVLAQVGDHVTGIVQVRAVAVPVSGTVAEDGVLVLEGVVEDRSGDRVDNRHRWRALRLTTDATGAQFSGSGTLEREYLHPDQSVRARYEVGYTVAADRATSLPTPTASGVRPQSPF